MFVFLIGDAHQTKSNSCLQGTAVPSPGKVLILSNKLD